MRRLSTIAGWLFAVAALPLPAAACPACYGASGPRVLLSYYLSTILLSLLPFAIVGTIVAVALNLRRQIRQQDVALDGEAVAHHLANP